MVQDFDEVESVPDQGVERVEVTQGLLSLVSIVHWWVSFLGREGSVVKDLGQALVREIQVGGGEGGRKVAWRVGRPLSLGWSREAAALGYSACWTSQRHVHEGRDFGRHCVVKQRKIGL